jgi:hypothetical protein
MSYIRYESTTITYHSMQWQMLTAAGWITHTVELDGTATMIRRVW